MAKLNYDAFFGKVKEVKVKNSYSVSDPDDEELEVTPKDVVDILGFDPKEFAKKYEK